jgi:hypothetical protein
MSFHLYRKKHIYTGYLQVAPFASYKDVKRRTLEYAILSSEHNIGYGQFTDMDRTRGGSLREITSTYSSSVDTYSFGSHYLDEVSISKEDGYFSDAFRFNKYLSQHYSTSDIDFMPIAETVSDANPDGISNRGDSNPRKISQMNIIKRMNLDAKDIEESVLNKKDIPQMGTQAWGKYHNAYKQTGSGESEAHFRQKMIDGQREARANNDDLTDVSVGYFGRLKSDMTVAPRAMYHELLELLPKTQLNQFGRVFSIQTRLFKSMYMCSGYIHRVMNGKIDGNKHGKIGFSKVNIYDPAEKRLDSGAGSILFTDFDDTVKYFPRSYVTITPRNGGGYDIKEHDTIFHDCDRYYVSIKVQKTFDTYYELIIVDFHQEVMLEGKKHVRTTATFGDTPKDTTRLEHVENVFLLPLTKSAMMKISAFDRNILIAESKSMFLQYMNYTVVKDYGILVAFIRVIAIVITIVSIGTASNLSTALLTLAEQLAIQIAIKYVVKRLVEAGIINEEWGAALTVVATVALSPGTQVDASLFMTLAKNTTTLVQAATEYYKTAMLEDNSEYKTKMEELKNLERDKDPEEENDFSGSLKEAILYNEVNNIKDEINNLLVAETPDEFYARCLNLNPQPLDITTMYKN